MLFSDAVRDFFWLSICLSLLQKENPPIIRGNSRGIGRIFIEHITDTISLPEDTISYNPIYPRIMLVGVLLGVQTKPNCALLSMCRCRFKE